MRMICRPAVTMSDLVTANVMLQRGRDLAANLRDHDETAVRKNLCAAKRLVGRDNTFHGVTVVLDLGETSVALDQLAFVGMFEGWRR